MFVMGSIIWQEIDLSVSCVAISFPLSCHDFATRKSTLSKVWTIQGWLLHVQLTYWQHPEVFDGRGKLMREIFCYLLSLPDASMYTLQ